MPFPRPGTPSSHPFLAAALLAITLGGAAPAPSGPSLAPLVDPPGSEHHPGKPILAELVTPDLDAARKFYAGMFGWDFQDLTIGQSRVAQATEDGIPVALLVERKLEQGTERPARWITFLGARDTDAAVKAAVQAGATVLFPPHSIPALGREAVLRDPQGAVFAILASSSGDPPDVMADMGTWIWSALLTTDPDHAAAFYQTLFGLDVFELPESDKSSHLILADGTYARASVNPLPQVPGEFTPSWLGFVRVDDAAALLHRAVTLGGKQAVAPHLDRHGQEVAVALDPQGAPIGLMEWSEDAQGSQPSISQPPSGRAK